MCKPFLPRPCLGHTTLGTRTANFACQNGRFESFSASGASGAAWAPEPSILLARMDFLSHLRPRGLQGRLGARTVNVAFQNISLISFSASESQNRQFCLPERRFGSFSASGGQRATWAQKNGGARIPNHAHNNVDGSFVIFCLAFCGYARAPRVCAKRPSEARPLFANCLRYSHTY